MWLFKSKNKAEKQGKSVRIDAEDLIEQGYTCAEIAEELGITQEEVYRIKQAKGRREARLSGKTEEDTIRQDRIAQLKEELSAVELQDRIDEAKHKAFLRQQERDEYLAEDVEDMVDGESETPDKLFNLLLLNAVKGIQPNNLNTGNPTPTPVPIISGEVLQGNNLPQGDSKPPFPSPEIDFNKIELAIKSGLVSEDKFIKEAETLKLSPEKAKALYQFIKKKL